MAFTDKSLKALKPKERPYRVFEKGAIRGFYVQVTPGGSKTFGIQYTPPGATGKKFESLGQYPAVTLADARKKAQAWRDLLRQDIDPRQRQAEERAAEERARKERAALGTIGELIEDFYAHQTRLGRRKADEVQRTLKANVSAVLPLTTPAKDITPRDVAEIMHAVIQRDALTQSNRVRSHLRTMFQYGLHHDNDPMQLGQPRRYQLDRNPADAVPANPAAERTGERDLSWAEIRTVWMRLGETFPRPVRQNASSKKKRGKPGGPQTLSFHSQIGLKLLLITGQRAGEVLQMRQSQLRRDVGLWEIPAEVVKMDRPHVVPLPAIAWELIDQLIAVNGQDCDLLFPSRGQPDADKPMLNSTLSNAAQDWCAGTGFPAWTPHDLRRTWKSRAGELGITKEDRDRVQNHKKRDVSSAHYDRYDYLHEKRRAMEAWARGLKACIEGDGEALRQAVRGDNVVDFPAGTETTGSQERA